MAPAATNEVLLLPVGHEVATVFIDANHNGRLDGQLEASAPCVGGRCVLSEVQLVVHRTVREGQSAVDETIATAHVFDKTTGVLDESAELCSEEGVCAGSSRQPGDGSVRAPRLSFCQTASLNLHGNFGEQRLEVVEPAAFHVDVALSTQSEMLRLEVTSPQSIDRLIVWLRRAADGDFEDAPIPVWTSEDGRIELQVTADLAIARVPFGALRDCSDCSIVIQAVHITSSAPVLAISEGQVIIPVASIL